MAEVSVVIRTHNSGETLERCLTEFRNQVLPPKMSLETVVVDHESADNTMKIAEKLAGQSHSFESLRPGISYSPGAALNAGINEASGDLVVICSSHCIPNHKESVQAFVLGAAQTSEIMRSQGVNFSFAGAYGKQVPSPALTPLQKLQLYSQFGLDWQLHVSTPTFFNGYSCVLKGVWNQYPFDETLTTFEDHEWSFRVNQAGGKIIYVPAASVLRMTPFWHEDTAEDALKVYETGLARILRPEGT